uniref:Uncharacterized protein n=1 Tax=Branchiostoma floridae TaxID=7739 RepID=Q8T758_BRAFL|nr:unknown [Branchiostoma floridae]
MCKRTREMSNLMIMPILTEQGQNFSRHIQKKTYSQMINRRSTVLVAVVPIYLSIMKYVILTVTAGYQRGQQSATQYEKKWPAKVPKKGHREPAMEANKEQPNQLSVTSHHEHWLEGGGQSLIVLSYSPSRLSRVDIVVVGKITRALFLRLPVTEFDSKIRGGYHSVKAVVVGNRHRMEITVLVPSGLIEADTAS